MRRFGALADGLGVSRTKLALAWALGRPGISSVIMGATTLSQLDENLGALSVHLDEPTLRALDEIFPP
jgi:NDP-hexose 2,3-enoyl reductase